MVSKKNLLQSAFQKMFAHYGPLQWWPARTPFEVMVGAILTQNTAWKNVEKAIANLKEARVLDPHRMSVLKTETLAQLIRPAGFFRVKAKRLQSFVEFFLKEYGGDVARFKKESLAEARKKLLEVYGIGPETADSILLYALEKPVFVIDAYTKRILSRHDLAGEKVPYEDLQKFFMDHLKSDAAFFNEYHAQLVYIGKDFCKTKPKCDHCPLNGLNWKTRRNFEVAAGLTSKR